MDVTNVFPIAAADHTQATAGTALQPQSIDGGFIDSDEEGPAATPAAAPAAVGRAAPAGGRRRVLPASLGPSQRSSR